MSHSVCAPPAREVARNYAIDWLRIALVLVVFFFHAAHIFDLDVAASVKNRDTSLALSVYAFFVYQWDMQLLFVLAGASAWFSLRTRTSEGYLRERSRRLLLPFAFGSLVLIPWNGYMSALNHGTFHGSYWKFVPVHFEGIWAALKVPPLPYSPSVLFVTSWHLWFLGYLMVFSLLARPLFLFAGAKEHRAAFAYAISWCKEPWALCALGLPILLIKLALDASFPSHTDWSETLVWATLYCYGWLFMTEPYFLCKVVDQAAGWLAVGCICIAMLSGAYAMGYLQSWMDHPAYTWDYFLYQVVASVNTWAWVLAIFGLGMRWLNFSNAVLKYAGECVLPFYILHQTVMFSIGFVVVQYSLGIFWKFLIITIGSLLATLTIYELALRRNNGLRIMFGMKGLPRR